MAGKSYLTPEKLVGRWFSLLSATLTTLAGACVGNLSSLTGAGTATVGSATRYTICMLVAFCWLGAIFYNHKKALDAAAKDETKDGLTGLTSSEVLALAVDEGIQNITGAMASILAQIWYTFLPISHGPLFILETFLGGCVILYIGERLQRSFTKGTMGEYIMNMLNGLNVGSVSWWVGLAMSNVTQNMFGAPDGESSKVTYTMWLYALVFAAAFMEVVNFLSAKMCQSPDSKPYGHVVFSALKGVPMFSSGWILNNVTQYQYTGEYIYGTFIWIGIASVVIIVLDQIMHMPGFKLPSSVGADDKKLASLFVTQVVSLLQQTFAFITGQLASFALADYLPSESNSNWLIIGTVFQVLGFLVESARTRLLPSIFKDAAARDYVLLAGA